MRYKFQCDKQEDLFNLVGLFTEQNASLGFELEAVVSEDYKRLKESFENGFRILGGRHSAEQAKKEVLELGKLSYKERIMPFSSYELSDGAERPELRHNVPDLHEFVRDFYDYAKNWLDNMTGLHRIVAGHGAYTIDAEKIRRPENLRVWKELLPKLAGRYKISNLSFELEEGWFEGEHREQATMFYSRGREGEVLFVTNDEEGDWQESLQAFFLKNKLNDAFENPIFATYDEAGSKPDMKARDLPF